MGIVGWDGSYGLERIHWHGTFSADRILGVLKNNGDTATGSYTFDSPTFHIDSDNHRVGIGTITPSSLLHIAVADGYSGEMTTTPLTTGGGWSHLGSGVYLYTTNGATSYLNKNNFLTIGKTYRLVYTIVANPSGTQLRTDTLNYFNGGAMTSTIGTHTYDQVAVVDDLNLRVSAGGASGLIISNISVKEIITGIPNILNVGTDGNVGIGNASPRQKLDVAGNIVASGGIMIYLVADGTISGGLAVRASRNFDNRCALCGIADGTAGRDQPIGIAYGLTASTSYASGAYVPVVVSGYTKVMVENTTTRGNFIQTSATTSGMLLSSAYPASPADANHWQECGHVLESGASGAFVNAVVHFN